MTLVTSRKVMCFVNFVHLLLYTLQQYLSLRNYAAFFFACSFFTFERFFPLFMIVHSENNFFCTNYTWVDEIVVRLNSQPLSLKMVVFHLLKICHALTGTSKKLLFSFYNTIFKTLYDNIFPILFGIRQFVAFFQISEAITITLTGHKNQRTQLF